ncbi:uncharacterized protein LOC122948489 isoform X2 [Acropora millepora]|uniref:uncharacterized protein LOC122948489 isoform X2 n=1 Tax=Acropora millepora TaxID=45264 RepID=UPI001CF47795|nr:uncharacterized protein LOC122948489 isoform X2 [Acropora millepora]
MKQSECSVSRYPTRAQLTAVAHLIVQTYQALKDQSVGTGYGKVSPRRMEESREMTFPFLIFTVSLESHDTIYLAADKHIICDFEASLVKQVK